MSIEGAVAELNEEIVRLTTIRDSLLQSPKVAPKAAGTTPTKTTQPAKATSVTTPAPAKQPAPGRKRTMSPEARQKISDANRKRWAAAKKKAAGK